MRNAFRRALGIAALSTLVYSGQVAADILAADLNDKSVKVHYVGTNTGSNLDFEGGFLYHKDDGYLMNVGARVGGQAVGGAPISGAMGGRLYYVNPEGPVNGSAFGVGGSAAFEIPQISGLELAAELYYAPSVLAFGKLDSLLDATLRIKYQVIENGSIYLGFRHVTIDTDKYGEGDLDEGVHFGMELDI